MSFVNGLVVAREQAPGGVLSSHTYTPSVALTAYGGDVRVKRRRLTPRVLRLLHDWLQTDAHDSAHA